MGQAHQCVGGCGWSGTSYTKQKLVVIMMKVQTAKLRSHNHSIMLLRKKMCFIRLRKDKELCYASILILNTAPLVTIFY